MCIELEHVQHRKNGREEIFQRRQTTFYCSIQLVRVERRKRRFSKGGKKEEMGNQWPPSSTLGSELAAKIQIHTHIQVMKANTHAYAYIGQNCKSAYRINQFLPMGAIKRSWQVRGYPLSLPDSLRLAPPKHHFWILCWLLPHYELHNMWQVECNDKRES